MEKTDVDKSNAKGQRTGKERTRKGILIDNSKGAPFFLVLFKNKQSTDNIVARHGGNDIFYSASDRPFYYVNTSSGEELASSQTLYFLFKVRQARGKI